MNVQHYMQRPCDDCKNEKKGCYCDLKAEYDANTPPCWECDERLECSTPCDALRNFYKNQFAYEAQRAAAEAYYNMLREIENYDRRHFPADYK